ncbi:MAG TPA: cytochrome c oxidase subunit 3 [Kofleriaceae bacterium]|nr:cytochrome c oxidase subunit 3 [Kofleriaceae bacterium]
MSEQPHAPHEGGGHGHDAHGHDDHGHGHGHGSRFIQHHYDDAQHQFDSGKLGIWLFLAQEVLFFSALFVAYILYRHHHPEIYSYAHKYLDVKYGAINTAVLIFSSLTAAWAVRAAQLGQKKLLIGCIAVTIGCALTFLGIKYIEYSHKIHEHILFGRYFDPCVSSGGVPLLTKNNECAGHKSTVEWKDGAATAGCYQDIDQDLAMPGVQADCKVEEVRIELYKPASVAAGATHDCAKVPAAIARGTGATFTFTGTCDEVMVVGDGNTVRIDQAKKVAVKGQGNTVQANAVDSFAGDASTKRVIAKGISNPQPALAGVTDADVDGDKERSREVKRTPIAAQCSERAIGHAEGHEEGHESAKQTYPCWRVGFQPAVCGRKANKEQYGVIVEYGDHEERDHSYRIDAQCKPTPKVDAPADPLAEKVQPLKVGEKALSPYHRPTTHEEHELEAAGPPPEHTNMFFTIYFAMTGLHGIHVLVGVLVFLWLLIRAMKGHFTPDYFGPIDFAALYWHIVDLIWIFLFPLLYLIH